MNRKRVYHVNQDFTECFEFHPVFGWQKVSLSDGDNWIPGTYDYIELRYNSDITKTKNGYILG